MIPELVDSDGPWNMLPPGIHDATLDEIEQRFATNDTRKRLYQGFRVGVDDTELAPVLLEFDHGRISQKLKYGGEFFPSSARADDSQTFLEYFQMDKDTENAKGIIRIRIT